MLKSMKFTSKIRIGMNISLIACLPIEKPHKNQLGLSYICEDLEALRESWTGEEVEKPTRLEGLSQMRARLDEMTMIVEENMKRLKENRSTTVIRSRVRKVKI